MSISTNELYRKEMKKKNILIFPAGTEIAFEVFNALKNCKFYNIFAGTSTDDHTKFVYENMVPLLPFVNKCDFIEKLNEVLLQYQIDYIYPAHDIAIDFFAEHNNEIHAEIVSSDYETVKTCRSKESTYLKLHDFDFVPKFYSSIEEVEHFPVFIKPKEGQGSQGAMKIENMQELQFNLQNVENQFIICEYLEGQEFSVDCFTDLNGNLKSAIMRDRARIRTGISVRSSICGDNPTVQKIAEQINSKFKFNGAWFFQLKKNAFGKFKLLEVSPRIPGTMATTRMLGINYPLMTLYNMQGIDCAILKNDYTVQLDRAFISRYQTNLNFDTIYVDLDDTLILNGRLNYQLLTVLYQNKENGKKICLLSRHAKNIAETLKEHFVSLELFDEILHIDLQKNKSDFIEKNSASIFIDDSFRERLDVKQKCNIPVFDVDMVEMLVDWRKL